MKKTFLLATVFAFAFAHAAELKLYIDGESRKAPGVIKIASGIRQVPGRFGKGLLIERRTVNFFTAADLILSDGAKLSGKANNLTLPADGYAALPLTAIRPKSVNALSFLYRGEGKITVSFGGKTLAEFTAGKEFKKGEALVIPEEDNGTLRIRSEKAVELTQVMFDKNIGWSNTYHAPGKMRTVDCIDVKPEVFNPESGAISCWIKAPWLKKDAKHSTAIALCDAKTATSNGRPRFYICVWSNGVNLITQSKAPKGVSCGFGLHELPASADGWYHFVFNWKAEKGFMNLSVIINGEKIFKKKGVCRDIEKVTSFTVGYVTGAYLNGILDDFGLFAAPLSEAEAKKIFTAKAPLGTLYKK